VTTGSELKPPAVPQNLRVTQLAWNSVQIAWDPSAGADSYTFAWRPISQIVPEYIELSGGNSTITELGFLSGSTEYAFSVRAKNGVGASAFSPEVHVTTPEQPAASASVSFMGIQTEGGGNWPDYFGTEGYYVANGASKAPAYGAADFSSALTHTWALPTTELRAPIQDPARSTRIASAYYEGMLKFEVNVTGGVAKDVILYCLDWDGIRNQELIQVVDVASQRVLHSQTIDNFGNGKYVKYRVNGRVRFQVSVNEGRTTSGVFSSALWR
jgi:hypothetical protein